MDLEKIGKIFPDHIRTYIQDIVEFIYSRIVDKKKNENYISLQERRAFVRKRIQRIIRLYAIIHNPCFIKTNEIKRENTDKVS